MSAKKRPGRPIDTDARARILSATRSLLEKVGVTGVTIEEIARQAGVGKPTIYRSWPNAHAVAMAALIDITPELRAARDDGPALNALRRQVEYVVGVFTSRLGRSAALLVAATTAETELTKAFRNQVILTSREDGKQLLARAIQEGDVRDDIDLNAVVDLVYAPVFFRLLVGHADIGEDFADQILDPVLDGIRTL